VDGTELPGQLKCPLKGLVLERLDNRVALVLARQQAGSVRR
jgi:hypothetical protein